LVLNCVKNSYLSLFALSGIKPEARIRGVAAISLLFHRWLKRKKIRGIFRCERKE